MVIWVIKTFFLYNSVYSRHLFLISSASVRSLQFLFFIMPILAWNVPLISPIFLKRSLLLPILLFSSISLHCSFKKAFFFFFFMSPCYSLELCIQLGIFCFHPCLSLCFFPQLFVKPPQITIFPSCIFFLFGMVLVTAFYTMLWTSVHSSSCTLSIRSNPLNLFITSTV